MADDDYRKLADILKDSDKRQGLTTDLDGTLRAEGADPAGIDDHVKDVLKKASPEELAFLARFNESLDRAQVPGGIQVDMV
jgi:hypothetical protein